MSTKWAQRFGYIDLNCIGNGAASTIYSARDLQTGRRVALKYVLRDSEAATRFVEQLEAEHAVAERVTHPGLRRTFTLKYARNLLCKVSEAVLAMEFIDGHPLAEIAPKPIAYQLDLFIKAADALTALHGM